MWSPQWAGRATGKGTVVVVLAHNSLSREAFHICLLVTILYTSVKQITRLKKVLVWAVYAAKKTAKMPGDRNDGHGHSFQSEAEDWMVPLRFTT